MKVHAILSPTLPTADLSERICARRWSRWKPLCILWLQQQDITPTPEVVEQMRQRHRGHLIACHAAQLADALVFRHQLDDPRRTDAERDAAMQTHMVKSEKYKCSTRGRYRKIYDVKERLNESHSQ